MTTLNRANRYFTSRQHHVLYKAQVQLHVEYCSHLWAEVPKYQLDSLESPHRRAIRIVNFPSLTDGLESLEQGRDLGSICVLYGLLHRGTLRSWLIWYRHHPSMIVPFETGAEFILTTWKRFHQARYVFRGLSYHEAVSSETRFLLRCFPIATTCPSVIEV